MIIVPGQMEYAVNNVQREFRSGRRPEAARILHNGIR